MTVEFGVYYQVYNNKKAASFVLENFRKHFPSNPVVLISDGGDDFTDIADKYDCNFHMRENIYGDASNNYPTLPYDSYRLKEWWKRQKLVCKETNVDYTMIMEDDVYVKDHFNIDPPFHLRGVRIGNYFSGKMKNEVKEKGNIDINNYGMCGGSIYNAKTLLEIYDDVMSDIDENHDELLKDNEYFLLGAVDANITYHFSKRGYGYEHASWLTEVREHNQNYPVIHQWKEHYQ